MKKAVLVFLFIFIFLFIAQDAVYARHRQRVLGASTSSGSPQIPPTVEGPGLILPDSPLFFLDQIKQNVRLMLAFTPDEKAKVHNDIAGERMAELRFMLAKNNTDGVRFTLREISDNLRNSSEDLNQAQMTGKNVSVLAKTINDNIKLKQKSLDILESQADGEMQATVKAAQESIMDTKAEVEDHLQEADLENELTDDLNREISRDVEEASQSAVSVNRAIDVLTREASDAAQKSQTRREEALLRAIETKNESLKRLEERKLEVEKKKQESLIKVQGEAAVQARKAVEEAQKAAVKYQEARKKAEEIKNSHVSEVTEVKPTTLDN